jgi:hypothetical protein
MSLGRRRVSDEQYIPLPDRAVVIRRGPPALLCPLNRRNGRPQATV